MCNFIQSCFTNLQDLLQIEKCCWNCFWLHLKIFKLSRLQALGLSGQKLLGIPIIVQHTQAEKNRMGNSMPNLMPKGMTGPMRLYVGSLHFNITEDMLRGIFEPFGKIDNIQLIMDPETGRSKGYGFITVSTLFRKVQCKVLIAK